MRPLSLKEKDMVNRFLGWDNYIRLMSLGDTITVTDDNREEIRKLMGNILIRMKRLAKQDTNALYNYIAEFNTYNRLLNRLKQLDIKNQKQIDQLEKYTNNLNELIESCEKTLRMLADTIELYCRVYSKVASDDDIASLLSVNIMKIKKARKRYESLDNPKYDFITYCIFVERVEDGDFPPFFECFIQRMMHLFETNRQFHDIVSGKMMEMLMEIGVKPLTIKTDGEGNVVEIKEYYPPLKLVKD